MILFRYGAKQLLNYYVSSPRQVLALRLSHCREWRWPVAATQKPPPAGQVQQAVRRCAVGRARISLTEGDASQRRAQCKMLRDA